MTLLALGAWMQPAFSATGTDANCDQSLDSPAMSLADSNELPLRLIEHGAAATTAADDISLGDSADPAATTPIRPTGPRVDIILRRIFDEARARQPNLSEPEQAGDLGAPLVVDQSENVEEPAAGLETDPVDSPAELPGLSADELHRYRKQMYRTDI
jgi:hypothetical protein